MQNYEYQQELGKGAFGVVSLYKRKRDNELVVIKKVEGLTNNDIDEAYKEADAMQELKHINIVKFIDAFSNTDKSCFFIVCEYCDGGDLRQKLNQQKGKFFELSEIVPWYNQICQGLSYCHEKDIIHRDLKPENILLRKGTQLKLTDFGVSRMLGPSTVKAVTYAGTENYMSPECISGEEYDKRTDIWALGCVVHELATLKTTFVAASTTDLVELVKKGEYRAIDDRYPSTLKEVISSCLKPNPDDRATLAKLIEMGFTMKTELENEDNGDDSGNDSSNSNTNRSTVKKPSVRRSTHSYRTETDTGDDGVGPKRSARTTYSTGVTVRETTGQKRVTVATQRDNEGKKRTIQSMGIKCIMDGIPGRFSTLVDRKTRLPIRKSQTYFTARDNQTEVKIEIYEGENEYVVDNTKLAEFELGNLPEKPKGEVALDVTFLINVRGDLHVNAVEKNNKENKNDIDLPDIENLEFLTIHKPK